VAAFVVASRFNEATVPYLEWTRASEQALRLAGYLLLFVGVLAAGVLAGWIVRKLLSAAALGWADRLAGGALAVVAALVLAAFVLLPVVAYAPGGSSMLERSTLAPYVAAVADLAGRAVPDDLERRWRDGIGAVRKVWQGTASREVVVRMPVHGDAEGLADDAPGS